MPVPVEIAPPKSENPVLLLRLNDKHEITVLQGKRFAGLALSNEPELINRILLLNNPAIKLAVTEAFEGERQMVRYQTEVGGQIIFCELHCFPSSNDFQQEITCLIINRTNDEAETTELKDKVYILDIIKNTVWQRFALVAVKPVQWL